MTEHKRRLQKYRDSRDSGLSKENLMVACQEKWSTRSGNSMEKRNNMVSNKGIVRGGTG